MFRLFRPAALALAATLVAGTALPQVAAAGEWPGQAQRGGYGYNYGYDRHDERQRAPARFDEHRVEHHEHDDNGALIGFGIAALAGAAIIAATTADQPAPPYPAPAYAPPPAYVPPAPDCRIINGWQACLGQDGYWHYVR